MTPSAQIAVALAPQFANPGGAQLAAAPSAAPMPRLDPHHDLLDDLAEADRADTRLLSLVLCAAAATLLLAAASSLGL